MVAPKQAQQPHAEVAPLVLESMLEVVEHETELPEVSISMAKRNLSCFQVESLMETHFQICQHFSDSQALMVTAHRQCS